MFIAVSVPVYLWPHIAVQYVCKVLCKVFFTTLVSQNSKHSCKRPHPPVAYIRVLGGGKVQGENTSRLGRRNYLFSISVGAIILRFNKQLFIGLASNTAELQFFVALDL